MNQGTKLSCVSAVKEGLKEPKSALLLFAQAFIYTCALAIIPVAMFSQGYGLNIAAFVSNELSWLAAVVVNIPLLGALCYGLVVARERQTQA